MTKIKCLLCGDILTGDMKGTFKQCSCGNIYIDETEYYCRIGFKDKKDFKILRNYKRKRVDLENGKERRKRNNIKTNKN